MAASDFWRADFGLLRNMVKAIEEAILRVKGVQEGWTFFKKKILKAQDQASQCATSCSLGNQCPKLEDKDSEKNGTTIIQGEMVINSLCNLDTHRSMGLNGNHTTVLRELAEVLTDPFSIIYQQSWLTGEVLVDWKLYDAHLQEGPSGGSRKLQACQPDLGARKTGLNDLKGQPNDSVILCFYGAVRFE
ncbi:rna-directed dna polymerase from mobile element jockey-like [Pitangus sulphuratus]|nr:rna-directed dna polymerase from mobile element jockey-like [Pitangus sulphuratus]